jgi:hypothetical protein
MQHVHVKRRLRRRSHSGETQNHNKVAAYPVVFVRRLCALHASQKTGSVKCNCADEGLQGEEDVDAEPDAAVHGGEVSAVVGGFVVDDYGEAGEEGEDAEEIEDGVDIGAGGFLGGRVGGLEYQYALCDKE